MRVLKRWDELPENMKNNSVRVYYEILNKKQFSLFLKRVFDVVGALVLIIIFSPILLFVAIAIKLDSKGPIIFKQVRVTQYGKKFEIYKFRTMVNNAEIIGASVTCDNDNRITGVGRKIRNLRIDEIPQLFNILKGEMSFVGTRPEIVKYVREYDDEMLATLLLPSGVTSEASIQYKDEAKILNKMKNVDRAYIDEILPGKMKYNLKNIREFSVASEFGIMVSTLEVVFIRKNNRKNT